jgi:hypothetical protein
MAVQVPHWEDEPTWGLLDSEIAHDQVTSVFASDIVGHAQMLAYLGCRGMYRKVPRGDPSPQLDPYMHHLVEVAAFLGRYGYKPPVVAAGFLHDQIEDVPDWTEERLRAELSQFGEDGEKIVQIVVALTVSKELDWLPRRQRYYQQVANGPPEARPVACADKISNMRRSEKLARRGFAPQDYLTKEWHANYDVWLRLAELFKGHVHPLLIREFENRLEKWREWGIRLDTTVGRSTL